MVLYIIKMFFKLTKNCYFKNFSPKGSLGKPPFGIFIYFINFAEKQKKILSTFA